MCVSTWLKAAAGTKMGKMRINLAIGGNRGFTLIELLVTMAIGTAIVGVMSMSIVSMMKIAPLNTDRSVVLQQVQNAGYWISRDVQMAQVVNLDEPGVLVHLEWDEWDGTNNLVDYVIDDDDILRRRLNGASPGMLVAQYVVVADTSFQAVVSSNSTYRLTMKAAKGEAELERVYDAYQRYASE